MGVIYLGHENGFKLYDVNGEIVKIPFGERSASGGYAPNEPGPPRTRKAKQPHAATSTVYVPPAHPDPGHGIGPRMAPREPNYQKDLEARERDKAIYGMEQAEQKYYQTQLRRSRMTDEEKRRDEALEALREFEAARGGPLL